MERTVVSIAEQVCDLPVEIVVSDHGSTDGTAELLAGLQRKYPFVRADRFERGDNHDYSHNFRHLFNLPQAEWTWLFGDDDILCPGAIELILPILKRGDFQFLHVAEASRSNGTKTLVKGKLKDLCNNVGWLDMTGFITGDIIRTEKLKAAAAVPSWDLYAKNAFVQSCAIYEVCREDFSALFDAPLVDVQNRDVTEETMARWNQFQVGERYHYVDDALIDMRNRGIIDRVTPKFFRYLGYHLWDRFLTQIINSYNTTEDFKVTPYIEGLLQRTMNLTTFLEPMEEKRYRGEVLAVKQSMIEHSAALAYAVGRAQHMAKLMDYHGSERYPFQYVKPQ